jgi:hypothetical protein
VAWLELVRNGVYFATLAAAVVTGFCFWRAERHPSRDFTESDTYGRPYSAPDSETLSPRGRVWLARGQRWLGVTGVFALIALFLWFLLAPVSAPPPLR